MPLIQQPRVARKKKKEKTKREEKIEIIKRTVLVPNDNQ